MWANCTEARILVRLSLFVCICLLVSLNASSQRSQTISIFVSADAKLGNKGDKNHPMNVYEAIDSALRSPSFTTVNVYFRGGNYSFSKPLVISTPLPDSTKAMIFSSFQKEKVVFNGSVVLDKSKFRVVSKNIGADLIPAKSLGRIYVVNLFDQGIRNFGKLIQHGAHTINSSQMDLIYNDEILPIARWPNAGYMDIGRVLDHGSILAKGDKDNRGGTFIFNNEKINSWLHSDNVWLNGYFSFGYTDDNLLVDVIDSSSRTIRVKQPTGYGIFSSSDSTNGVLKNARNVRGFYVYNLLTELDSPGEWYFDQNSGNLYLWPPDENINAARISITSLEEPLVVLSNTINVVFRGITFSDSRGLGILLEHTFNTLITNCTFINLGKLAVSTGNQYSNVKVSYERKNVIAAKDFEYNINLKIESCIISNMGTGGIYMDGGNRKNLVRGNNTIENCEIYNYSRINKTYCPAVFLDGVGNQVIHCYMHDAPDQAILFSGNDHFIGFNHFKNVANWGSDMGAVYTGLGVDLSSAGTKIFNNLFDSIISKTSSSVCALYFDNAMSNFEVDSNIFYYGCTPGYYHFGAVHINGGANNVFRNNYFVYCDQAFSSSGWNNKKWLSLTTGPMNYKHYYQDVNVKSDLYLRRYGPSFYSMFDSSRILVRQNYIFNTLAYKVTVFSSQGGLIESGTFETSSDPGFISPRIGNFNLIKRPLGLKDSIDWKPISCDLIGIIKTRTVE